MKQRRQKREHGRIMSVETKVRGDALAEDALAGAATLIVGDAADFDEDGGWLVINDQVIEFTEVDDDEGVITLSTGLLDAADEGDAVHVWSTLYEEVVDYQEALVELDGKYDNPEPVVAEVAEGVGDLPEGDRGVDGESCTLLRVSDDEWEVVGVGGRARKSKSIRWEHNDTHTLTAGDIAAGNVTVRLSHRPMDESIDAKWNGLGQHHSNYTIDYDNRTVTWPLEGFERAGDLLAFHYTYRKSIGTPRQRLSIPLGYTWRYATGLGSSTSYAQPGFDDSSWAQGPTPFGWNYPEVSDGGTPTASPLDVWYRTTAESFGGALALYDAHADNSTEVYIDGVLVATLATIDGGGVAALVEVAAGVHTIAVHGTDDGASGGYSGLTVNEQ